MRFTYSLNNNTRISLLQTFLDVIVDQLTVRHWVDYPDKLTEFVGSIVNFAYKFVAQTLGS